MATTYDKLIDLPGLEVYTDEVKKLIKKMISESSDFEIITADTYLNFPVIGNEHCIYIDSGANATYRWNEADLHYYCIGRDYENVDLINSDWDS